MTTLVEEVVLAAQERLETTGRLDIEAYVLQHPEHETELRRVLPAMLAVHRERLLQELEAETFEYAIKLFSLPVSDKAQMAMTVGALITEEIESTARSLEDYAKRTNLPIPAVSQLLVDPTPIGAVKNSVVKELASRVSAPFSALLVELNRLVSLRKTDIAGSALVFTREASTSTDEEHRELIQKVRASTGRSTKAPD